MRAEIERLVLLARAQLQLGKRSGADDTLRRGLELGRPDRYIRVFLDDADHLLDLLRGIAGRYPDTYLSELVDPARTAAGCSAGEPSAEIVEPLSGREREVLGHLPTHLSQREIADTMYVSINTVKSHTAAVYRKLGAAPAHKQSEPHGYMVSCDAAPYHKSGGGGHRVYEVSLQDSLRAGSDSGNKVQEALNTGGLSSTSTAP